MVVFSSNNKHSPVPSADRGVFDSFAWLTERFLDHQRSGYLPARILGPLNGAPKSGANTQKSNMPAARGTSPTINTIVPVVALSIPKKPQTTNARPTTMRTIRPFLEAMKDINGFMFFFSF
jgi:hypothetical protein